jgi:predicted SnoaL-like aldol condensation-catalyzing enzyme
MSEKIKEKKSTYQIMTSILSNYKPNKIEKLSINGFFFVRYLSNNPKAIHIGNVFNRYYKEIPLNIQYDIAKQLLKGKIKFIQFPKKEKHLDETITNISKYYKINLDKAKEYWNLMPEKEREYFRTLYEGA